MTKHYGRYGFPSDPIADCSIQLIHVALELCEVTCNDVYNFSWIIGIPYAISSMNDLFDKKRQINILGKFPSDSNVRNITHNCEFSNAVLRHAIRMLPGINEKTQSYIFTSGPGSLPSVLSRSIWYFMCFFLLPRTPARLNHCMHSFARSCWPGNIYRYIISTKILAWSTNSIEVVLMFSKKSLKLFTGVTAVQG